MKLNEANLDRDNVKKFPIKGPRRFTAAQLLAHPPSKPEMIIDGMLPVGLSYLAGRPKSGKSLLAGQIARAVTDDSADLFGLEVRHGPVLYIDLENSKWRIYDRFLKGGLCIGPGADRLHFILDWNQGNRTLFLELLDEIEPVLAVIDVWAKFRAPIDTKADRYEFEGQELSWLHDTANQRDMAILGVGHRTKFDDPNDPFTNFAGSTAITAGVDTALAFSKVPGDTCLRELQMRGRDTGDESWIVRIDERLNCTKVCSGEQLVTDDQAHYLKTMGSKIWQQAALAQELGVSKQAVSKMLARLGEKGLVHLTVGGTTLTEAGMQMIDAL